MSVQIRRFQGEESEFTKAGRRRAQVCVPGSIGYSDLSESKVMLEMEVVVAAPNGNANVNDIPHPVTFTQPSNRTNNTTYSSPQGVVGPQALIKNARVKSRDHGLLNEQRHQNVLSSNLDWYQKSRAQTNEASLFGNTLSGNYGINSRTKQPESPFLMVKKPSPGGGQVSDANEPATERRTAMIPVDWKHIDQFASIQQFPNVAVGEIDYHIEFEDQIDVVCPAEQAVYVMTCDDRAAVGGTIGSTNDGIATSAQRSYFNYIPVVGEQVYVDCYFEDTGSRYRGFHQIAAVGESGNAFDIELNPFISCPTATEQVTNITMYRGPGVRAGITAYQPANIAAVALNTGIYPGGAGNELRLVDFFGEDAVADCPKNYDNNPFYVGAWVHYSLTEPEGRVSYWAKITSMEVVAAVGGNTQLVDLKLGLSAPLDANGTAIAPNPYAGGVATTNTLVAGTGYAPAPGNLANVATTGGTGTGCTVDITIDGGGTITAVTVNQMGNGYTVGDTLTVTGGNADATFDVATLGVTNNAISDIILGFSDHTSDLQAFEATWTVKEIYAQMNVLNLTPPQQEQARKAVQAGLQIPWMEQRLVQKNMTSTTNFADVTELLPNCAGVAVLTPFNLELVSSFDSCEQYRFALDGKEVTDRLIEVRDWYNGERSLHNHFLKKYFGNLGKSLYKYDAPWTSMEESSGTGDNRTHAFYPLVVPQKPDYTVMQLQLFSTNAMAEKNVFVVSSHQKMLTFRNGMVSVN
jgi:hypothetical protein